jgi:hypothetical protein
MLDGAFLLTTGNCQSLTSPIPDSSPKYASVYGPRQISAMYDFHKGIDYVYPRGTPFYSVESGVVAEIKLGPTNEWVITVLGNTGFFQYLHSFSNAWSPRQNSLPTDSDGNSIYGCYDSAGNDDFANNCAGATVTLELLNESSPKSSSACFAIIFWSNFDSASVAYALSPCDGLTVGNGKTTSSVTSSQILSLVGNSGKQGIGPHLHLQSNFGYDSALKYVLHDSGTYGISFAKDQGSTQQTLDSNKSPVNNGSVLDLTKDFPLVLRVQTDYEVAGNDLDQLQIFFNRSDSSLGAPKNAFNYGGAGAGRNVPFGPPKTQPLQNGISAGVYPQATPGTLHGLVDFLANPINQSDVWPGDYDVTARATSVLGQQQPDQKVTLQIAPLLGTWSGSGTFIDSGDIDTVQVDATVTQQGDSITVTLVITDGQETLNYTETGQISSTGPNFSITTFISSTGETVSIMNGTFGNGGLSMSATASVTDQSGTEDGIGTASFSSDGKTITGNATTSAGRSVSWKMTKQ